MSDTPEPVIVDEAPSPAAEPIEAVAEAPVEAPVEEPVEKPVKRARAAVKTQEPAPVMVTVRNPSRRLIVLEDSNGDGIYLLPLETKQVLEERISASIKHQAALGLIVLS